MASIEDKTVFFQPVSLGFQPVSLLAGEFGGYSTGAAAALRTLSPSESSAATIARFVCTLAQDLMANKQ